MFCRGEPFGLALSFATPETALSAGVAALRATAVDTVTVAHSEHPDVSVTFTTTTLDREGLAERLRRDLDAHR